MEEDKSLPGSCFPTACIVVRYNISYNNSPPKISAGCALVPADEYAFNAQENTAVID